ncbi:MAG: hypothetical protein M3252_06200 [Actinomycetota bacterium]|nr:hypothetical protein [Actinomycetota bacterium]
MGGAFVSAIAVLGALLAAPTGTGTPTAQTQPGSVAQTAPVVQPEPAPDARVPPQPTTAKAELERTLGHSSRLGRSRLTSYEDEGDTIAVVFAIDDNLTTNLTNRSWRREVVEILETVRRYYPGRHVTIGGTFAMRDAHGNTGEKQVVLLNYSPETIQHIDWSEDARLFLHTKVVEIADPSPKMVHPQFATVKP